MSTSSVEPWAEIDHSNWIAGGTMWLTVSVSNAGPASAAGTLVTVPAVAGFLKRAVACSLSACPTAAELEAGWSLGWLPSSARVQFFIEHTLAPTSGPVSLRATATQPAGVTDSNPSNNADGRHYQVYPNTTDLHVTMPPPTSRSAQTGSQAASRNTFRVVVENTGPIPVEGTVVVPPVIGLQMIGVTCLGGPRSSCPASVTVSDLEYGRAIHRIGAGSSMTYAVETLATSTGSVTMTASAPVPAWLTDTAPADNSASATVTVTGSVSPADVRVTMGVLSQTPQRISYEVRVWNLGPGQAGGTVLTVPAVPGLVKTSVICLSSTTCPSQAAISDIESGVTLPTLGAQSGGSIVYRITSMAVGSGTVNVTADVTPPPGVTDPNTGNNSSSLSATMSAPPAGPASADLNVTVATAGPSRQGYTILQSGFAQVTYTVVVRNLGPGAAHGAVVTVPAMAGVTKTETECVPGTGSASAQCPTNLTPAAVEAGVAMLWLPSGGQVTINITANVLPTINSVTLTASAAPPSGITDPVNYNDAAQTTVMIQR